LQHKNISAIFEQFVLSGVGLLVNFALVYTATKAEFGAFALLNSYLILAVSIQTALLSTPMMVEISRASISAHEKLIASAFWILLPVVIIAATISITAVAWISNPNDSSDYLALSAAFGVAMIGTWLREFTRTTYILQERLNRSFWTSCAYAVVVVAGMAAAYRLTGTLTPTHVFMCTGIGATLSSVDVLHFLCRRPRLSHTLSLAKDLSHHARWALPGVFTIWAQNNAYLSIMSTRFTLGMAADLAASRLFVMPYLTAFSGFTRPLTSQFSKQIGEGDQVKATQKALKLAIIQLVFCFGMALIFLTLNQLNLGKYLGSYKTTLGLASAWSIFAGVTAARGIWSVIGQVSNEFRYIFFANIASVFIVLLLLYIPIINSSLYVIFILSLGELSLLFLLWRRFQYLPVNICE
jgi:O-antigen/teichoic acid export membrane protein